MTEVADKISPSTSACGNCLFGQRVKDNLAMVECRGLPPHPVLMGFIQGPTGPNASIDCFYPRLAAATPACALHKPKLSLILGGSNAKN